MLLANETRTQQLESDLATLAPKLSSLTVLLRTTVLAAISLVNPEAATRLQVVHPILSYHADVVCLRLSVGGSAVASATSVVPQSMADTSGQGQSCSADSDKSSHHKQSNKHCVQCTPMTVLLSQQQH